MNILGNLSIDNARSTVSNLAMSVHGLFGFSFSGRLADRLIVSSNGADLRTCSIFHGILRDSVCSSVGGAAAIYSQSSTVALGPVSASLRNVTAYCTGRFSAALLVGGTSGSSATINVTNSIIEDVGGFADIRAYSESAEHVSVRLDHSNFHTVQRQGPTDVVTAPGHGGNQTRAPRFVNAGRQNFHEASGSPTIDFGTRSGITRGELDAEGNARAQGKGPDAGAYEFPVAVRRRGSGNRRGHH